jgi:hypothetical protein
MTTTWIPLLVPEQDYLDLAAVVAKRLSKRGEEPRRLAVVAEDTPKPTTPLDEIVASALVEPHPWSDEDLYRLATSDAVTAQRWARAMDVCARVENQGRFLSTREVASQSGMTINEWRDAPRKIKRHLASNYPQVNGHWPLRAKAGRQIGRPDDQVYWAINAEQAARWINARSSARSVAASE